MNNLYIKICSVLLKKVFKKNLLPLSVYIRKEERVKTNEWSTQQFEK